MKGLIGKWVILLTLTKIGSKTQFSTLKIELAVKLINASSGQDATSVTANLESGEHKGITASSENVSERNNTLHMLNTNDETRNNISDEVSELLVPGAHFHRQPDLHHRTHVLSLIHNCIQNIWIKIMEADWKKNSANNEYCKDVLIQTKDGRKYYSRKLLQLR